MLVFRKVALSCSLTKKLLKILKVAKKLPSRIWKGLFFGEKTKSPYFDLFIYWLIKQIIIHSTHYLFSDWPKAYSEFSKSVPGTSSTCRLYNNHVKTLKVTGNHVMYDRGAWFLSVIMSSSRALCCLPSVKKQKHDFQVCFVDWARHRKKYLKAGTHKTLKARRRWQRGCLLIMWKRKNW